MDESGAPRVLPTAAENYAHSKAGNLLLAKWFKDELRDDGVLSVVS